MQEFRIALRDIAHEGQSFQIDDQRIWEEPIHEFGLSCRIAKPLRGEVFVLPEEEGCLIRGKITGEVIVPCDRCSEDTHITVNHSFDEFEEYSPDSEEDFFAADSVLVQDKGTVWLDLASLVWEEFSLSLPLKPLCKGDCKGVCPTCGKNLNEGMCSCSGNEGDPRLAALRNLKVQ